LQGSESEQWSPATIFVVTDHLVQLLVKNLFRRQGTVGGCLPTHQHGTCSLWLVGARRPIIDDLHLVLIFSR